jgi:hypothetical protein
MHEIIWNLIKEICIGEKKFKKKALFNPYLYPFTKRVKSLVLGEILIITVYYSFGLLWENNLMTDINFNDFSKRI